MSNDWKYIVVKGNYGTEVVVMFPPLINHDEVAPLKTAVSAGFVKIYYKDDKITAQCYGKSTSLKIGSRPEDDKLVQLQIELGGWNE